MSDWLRRWRWPLISVACGLAAVAGAVLAGHVAVWVFVVWVCVAVLGQWSTAKERQTAEAWRELSGGRR